MDYINIFLSSLGSVASILGLASSLRKGQLWKDRILYGLIVLSSLTAAVISFKYSKEVDKKLELKLRKEQVQLQAKKLIEEFGYVDYFDPGKSEGLLLSTLSLLENNRDLNPDSYELYKEVIVDKLRSSSELDGYERREKLKDAGSAALQILKGL